MKEIAIYTSVYPYSLMAESFVGEELRIATQFDCEVTVIPIGKEKIVREMPSGITLDNSLCERSLLRNVCAFLRILKPLYLKEVFYNKKRPLKLNFIVDTIKYLYAANLVYSDLCKRSEGKENILFYSYWTSYTPIAFAEYKLKNPRTTHRFICRSHTFASYGTDVVPLYYPMRDFVFKHVDKFYTISSVLLESLKKVYPQYNKKFQLSRLGVIDNYNSTASKTESIEIVSCSSMILLKRVDLIFRSINNYAQTHSQQHFVWTHIGDGELKNEIKELIDSSCNLNLTVNLMGGMKNADILSLYKKKRYNVFVLLSEREGLPVVLMEAISSGIPIIATNVGGIPDIVTEETGILVGRDFKQEDFDEALENIIAKNDSLSESCHNFYVKNFSSESNYKDFYLSLLSL